MSATFAAKSEQKISTALEAAQAQEREPPTPNLLRGLITPGPEAVGEWETKSLEAKHEIAQIVLSPDFVGVMRLGRRVAPDGSKLAVADRVTYLRDEK